MSTRIDIKISTPSAVSAELMKTGQTTTYRTGDDGDLEKGRPTDFFTLAVNNPFGNTNRFTDTLGGTTYANNWVIDWSTYNGSNVLGYHRVRVANKTWFNAIDECYTLTFGGFSGCRLPNIQEFFNIMRFEGTLNALNYSPFTSTLGGNAWASTTNPLNGNAYNIQSFSVLEFGKSSSGGAYFPCRTFTVTGTTLT